MNTIFQDNKYTKLYYSIITKYGHQVKPKNGNYYERHHIVPKSLGGSHNKSNLIYLEIRVHFIVHAILCKAVLQLPSYKGKMLNALFYFRCGKFRNLKCKLSSRAFAKLKIEHHKSLKDWKWYTDGLTSLRLFPEESVPEGFISGRSQLPKRGTTIYITNGLETKRIKPSENIPDGWWKGQKIERLLQLRHQGPNHKMGTGAGRTWINNGLENKYLNVNDTLPAGWVKGRLKTGNFNPTSMRTKSSGTTGKTWTSKSSNHASQSPA